MEIALCMFIALEYSHNETTNNHVYTINLSMYLYHFILVCISSCFFKFMNE